MEEKEAFRLPFQYHSAWPYRLELIFSGFPVAANQPLHSFKTGAYEIVIQQNIRP